MRPLLFGLETEFALFVSPRSAHGGRSRLMRTMTAMLREAASLPDGGSGIFLANACRYYLDAGYHPELCSAECTTPEQLVRWQLASEKILADALIRATAQLRLEEGVFFRSNVDYSGSGATWGCHESYLTLNAPPMYRSQLVPHLISRIVFTGAGGFDNKSPGLQFLLSSRSTHMEAENTVDTMRLRGVFHDKDESHATGSNHRLHLICGESLCSQTANALKMGTTALIVRLIEADLAPAATMRTSRAVALMRGWSGDPSLRACYRLSAGQRVRAIDVQRTYLENVERHVGTNVLPDWAEDICRLWRSTLDRLEDGADAVADRLDWAIKRDLFLGHAERCGFDEKRLAEVSEAFVSVFSGNRDGNLDWFRRGSGEGDEPGLRTLSSLLPQGLSRLSRHGVDRAEATRFIEVRADLMQMDQRFGQLGAPSIFDRLDEAGVVAAHRLPNLGSIDEAKRTGPPTTRAGLRGRLVHDIWHAERAQPCLPEPSLQGDTPDAMLEEAFHGSRAGWSSVFERNGPEGPRRADLGDPFETEVRWTPEGGGGSAPGDVPRYLERWRSRERQLRGTQAATPPAEPPTAEQLQRREDLRRARRRLLMQRLRGASEPEPAEQSEDVPRLEESDLDF